MYIAHIRESDSEIQSVKEHLQNTAYRAKVFADSFNNGNYGYIAGLFHDIGKYSSMFQKKISCNSNDKVDHSTAGAIEINNAYKIFGKLLAYCIAGHHGGIPDGGSISDNPIDVSLNGRLKRKDQLPAYMSYKSEIDISNLPPIGLPDIKPLNKGGFSLSFFIQ